MPSIHQLIRCISYATHIPSQQICISTNIREDLNLDSLDYLLLIVKVENHFKVNIADEQITRIETVKDLWTILTRQSLRKEQLMPSSLFA